MGKSASGGKQRVVQYRLSLHMGIALALDGIKEIFFGEKSAWTGDVREETVIAIQQPNLHGGIKEEGGAAGLVFYLPGGQQQTLPDGLAQRMGLTQATCPGFRGLSSIFLVGNPAMTIDGDLTSSTTAVSGFGSLVGTALREVLYQTYKVLVNTTWRGFYLGANNPYLKSIWVKGWRAPKGLNPGTAMIGPDANGAHIIFEALTNREWGMGASTGIMDIASWETAATALYNEGLGLSFMWTRQTSVESMVNEVLDHIQAAMYLNVRTGLMAITLFRNDYDVDNLRIIRPSNARLTNYQRKTWGETINELVVTYTDPTSETDATVTCQDLGNIAMQGTVVSDSRNYYAVRNSNTAMALAQRDLAASAAPLVTCEAELSRALWDVLPGEVFKLEWPEYGIDQIIVRATTVDYGKPDSGTLKISLLEDIFSIDASEYTAPPDSAHVDTSETPRPIDHVRINSAPAYLVNAIAPAGSGIANYEYPEVATMILAAQTGEDTSSFDLYAYGPDNVGALNYRLLGKRNLVGRGELTATLAAGVTSTIPDFDNVLGFTPGAGWFILVGNDSDGDDLAELMLVTDNTDAGWPVTRGILDTVPRTWAAGTTVWFVRPDAYFIDTTIRAEGETVNYKIATRTSLGVLSLADAPAEIVTLNGRPQFPLRPANVQVGGSGFGTTSVTGLGNLSLTWANRNRLTETGQILLWNDGSVTPEAGQTTKVTLMTTGGTVLNTYIGLPGTGFTVPVYGFAGNSTGKVAVSSVRDGLESLQEYELSLSNIANGIVSAKSFAGPQQSITAQYQIVADLANTFGHLSQAATGSFAITASSAASFQQASQSIAASTSTSGSSASSMKQASQSIAASTGVTGSSTDSLQQAHQSITATFTP